MLFVSISFNIIQFGIVWMTLAAVIVYKTNFFRQVWENPKVNSFFLNIALICIAFMMTVLVWISFIGPCVKGHAIEFETDMP
jgi:hypothetical protein